MFVYNKCTYYSDKQEREISYQVEVNLFGQSFYKILGEILDFMY